MSKILFVGKFNDTTKAMQSYLAGFYATQLCSDNVAIASSMFNMYGPDLVLINIEGLDKVHAPLFEDLAANHEDIPVVTFGGEKEYAYFETFYSTGQMTHLMQPVDEKRVFQEIHDRIGKDTGAVGEEEVTVEEKKLVLLVDDSPVILRGMKQMLEKYYRIMMATSGMQAMQAIAKEQPDAIILDYEMPECDGKETLEMIRKNEKTSEIPVIFLTGHGDAEHIRSVLDLKPAAYFLKPPKAEKILETLGQII